MKIFLSALEQQATAYAKKGKAVVDLLLEQGIKMKWNLMSYYYIRNKEELACKIRDNSEEVLIDSGAHSIQFGAKVDFEKYTRQYAEFITRFDRDNVIGYFEMDIENIIGYEKVLYLRSILEAVSDKIIPVWHPLRGINDYEKMCQKYAGKIIAIGGFRGTDIKDDQFLMFVKVARKYGCKVHCLGMTRKEVLNRVPFDFTDSASWAFSTVHGKIGHGDFSKGKVTMEYYKAHQDVCWVENYKAGIKTQELYHRMWRKECKD